jgi:hypothetical protein
LPEHCPEEARKLGFKFVKVDELEWGKEKFIVGKSNVWTTNFVPNIFLGRIWKGEKAENQMPLKKSLQLHQLATSFSIFIGFFIVKENEKNTFNNDFCSLKDALFNGVLEVKSVLCFHTKILLFVEETEKFGRSHYLAILQQ